MKSYGVRTINIFCCRITNKIRGSGTFCAPLVYMGCCISAYRFITGTSIQFYTCRDFHVGSFCHLEKDGVPLYILSGRPCLYNFLIQSGMLVYGSVISWQVWPYFSKGCCFLYFSVSKIFTHMALVAAA